MNDLIIFFEEVNNRSLEYTMEIYYSSIVDWRVTIGYKYTHPRHGEMIVDVQHCDKEYVFAKAQVLFKEWLLEHESGY